MSTITRELAKLFRKITNSEIDAEGNAHVVLSPADSLLINNARIALASLEAEASGRNPVLAYADSYRNMANHGVESIPVWSVITDLERNIAPLFTAPPAPVSVPDAYIRDERGRMMLNGRQEPRIGYSAGWNACRAAMLQSFGNSEQLEPVTTTYKLSDAVEALRNSGIAIDAEKIQEERDALNSPAIPDGWVTVPEEPTHENFGSNPERCTTKHFSRISG